jgi:thiosulfate/3-mercaptopyruvate sulfurtransferase
MVNAKMKIMVGLLALLLCIPTAAFAAEPIVTAEWLQANLSKVTAVDIRKVEDYNAGHIPGAINVFYGVWAIQKTGLFNELPADDDLKDILSAAGIEPTTQVVVVGKSDTPSDRADMTRVAFTLRYAGVENVAVLNGGMNKWAAEEKPVSKDAVKPKAKPYRGKFNKQFVVNKAYVTGAMGKALIVDVREADFYTGAKKLDFVAKAGRIKGAVNLPTMSKVFNADGTYKSKAELETILKPVVGTDMAREIIVYCDSGKVCTVWWLLLSDMSGYKNVKAYDGSMQDWAKDGVMEP